MLQRSERALIFALKPRLIAVQHAEGWAGIGEVLEGERNQLRRGLVAIFLARRLLIDVFVEDTGLDTGETGDAPGDCGELVDQIERGLGAGLEMGDIGLQAGLVLLPRFRGEDDGLRGESVRGGVAGGGAKSGFSFGPARFGAVGAGGFDAAEGGHGSCLIEDKGPRAGWELMGGGGCWLGGGYIFESGVILLGGVRRCIGRLSPKWTVSTNSRGSLRGDTLGVW